MIDFRYHLVSLIAVFLALAVGIVLGGTALRDPLLDTLGDKKARLRAETERLRAEKDAAERLASGGDRLADAFADRMLGDRLSGVGVAVVEAPGVPRKLREGVVERIEQAGGTVPARLVVSDSYLDPDRSAFVGELTGQLASGAGLARGSAHDRAGALLARALRDPGEKDPAEEAGGFDPGAVLAGFAHAGLLAVHGDPGGADAAVVLAPGRPAAARSAPERPGADGIMLDTVDGLHEVLGAAVLVGRPSAAAPGGLLQQARADGAAYSTVDAAGGDAGDVAAALALAAATEGRRGDYGVAEGADGFLPRPLPGTDDGGDAEDGDGDDAEDGPARPPAVDKPVADPRPRPR
ncbi:copper transporter [Streptomonospora sp. PA3]|uniref:copper transporter n=1 Tax=Streptomonospora sp. PA3 TaxID=2607326 RepID=UPI00130CF7FE|nr:copper transporter [Streptomonospora sp. PA3]